MPMKITKPSLMLLIGLVVTGCSTSPALHVIGVYEGTRPVVVIDDVSKQKISNANPTQTSIPTPAPIRILNTTPITSPITTHPENKQHPSTKTADMTYVETPSVIAGTREQVPHVRKAEREEKEIVVNVSDTTQPIILAFSAYDRTHWKVSLQSGVKIVKVILAGYHSQRISGIPSETPIETYTYDPSPCARCWQSAKYFYSYKSSPEQLKEITGLDPTSFQGRYRGTEFSIYPGIMKVE